MDDRLTCGRNVPGSTRQTNALLFYSLGNEVDKRRSRTAPLIYKSIVIGSTDKLGTTIRHTSFYQLIIHTQQYSTFYSTHPRPFPSFTPASIVRFESSKFYYFLSGDL